MTPEKAIEILKDIRKNGTDPGYPIDDAALKLGIEALKRLDRLRDYYGGSANELLPGETEE